MANLFNSNPLMGLGLALSTFGGQESLGGAINLLNYAQRQQLIDEERRKEEVQNIAASTLLKNAGAVGSPEYRKRTFTPNPEDAALGVNPVTFGSDAPAQNLLSSSMETGLLAKAIGPQNLLSMKMASEAEASKPRELAAGAILTNSKGDILARNNKPPEIPSEAALVKYYQSLPDGPEKAQLGAVIRQKTEGSGEPLIEIYDANSPTGSRLVPRSQAAGVAAPSPGRQGPQQLENTLRDEFNKEAEPFKQLRSNYAKIVTAQNADTAAGDLSLIFGYMKMLDPGSVVRENEFATAQNAAGVPDRIRNIFNRVKDGTRLTPEQRADFAGRANDIYQSQKPFFGALTQRYSEIAKRQSVNPANVVTDVYGVEAEIPAGPQTKGATVRITPDPAGKAAYYKLPKGTKYIDPQGITRTKN